MELGMLCGMEPHPPPQIVPSDGSDEAWAVVAPNRTLMSPDTP
jgi:hypothetical protein